MAENDAGKRLREARTRAKLTQQELAVRMGVAAIAVAQHEGGRRQMRADWVERYATVLGVSPAWLMFGEAGDGGGCSMEPMPDGRTRVRMNVALPHDVATAIMSIVYSATSRRGQTAPHDGTVLHEQRVLGNLLLQPDQVLASECFFREPVHQRIWEAADWFDGEPAGLALHVANVLREDDAFNELGGIKYLADLIDNGFSQLTEAHVEQLNRAKAE